MSNHSIILAATSEHYAQAKCLFEAYQKYLGIDLCFQGFAAEIDSLSTMYGPPRGALLLAMVEKDPVGCVGLRDLGDNIAEMKRMYVLPLFQGRGIGKALTTRIIATARLLGYDAIRLDTIPKLERAVDLYRRMGFTEIEVYRHNPDPTALFLQLRLQ